MAYEKALSWLYGCCEDEDEEGYNVGESDLIGYGEHWDCEDWRDRDSVSSIECKTDDFDYFEHFFEHFDDYDESEFVGIYFYELLEEGDVPDMACVPFKTDPKKNRGRKDHHTKGKKKPPQKSRRSKKESVHHRSPKRRVKISRAHLRREILFDRYEMDTDYKDPDPETFDEIDLNKEFREQEPSEQDRINIGFMKELSGNDRIMTRGLYKEPCEFKPQFKMILTCNELPEVPSDDGTWRKIRVIEFTSKFCENPVKPNEFADSRRGDTNQGAAVTEEYHHYPFEQYKVDREKNRGRKNRHTKSYPKLGFKTKKTRNREQKHPQKRQRGPSQVEIKRLIDEWFDRRWLEERHEVTNWIENMNLKGEKHIDVELGFLVEKFL
jgi:hypothetical protein